jgi:actin-like ATPase involved in cell morphogenesis
MSYGLGIDVGTSFTAAAVCRGREQGGSRPEVVPLGTRAAAVASVIFLGEDGQVVVGDAAERRALTDPDRVVREFKRRLGDDIPLVVGGEPYGAHEVTALMVRWVVDRVTEREGGPPEQITLTLPASWGPHRKELLGQGLGKVDLEDVAFLTEPEAAAFSYASQERVEPSTTIAVYDLGGGTFDAAVVRKTEADHFDVLGRPEGVERLGGVDFDDAVLAHVEAGVGPAMAELDPSDPDAMAAMARLRRDCTEAKEALSSDTEVIIPVMLPGARAQVRLVRAEFEAMIRPVVEDSIESLRRAMRSAAVEPGDLDAVLLVGGSSRVPLVSQLVSAELGRAASIDADPKTTIAAGAALSAASMAGIALLAAEPVEDEAEPATALIPVGATSAQDTAAPEPVASGPGSGASGRPAVDSESWETPSPRARLWQSHKVKGLAAAGLLAAAVVGTAALVPYSLAGNLALGNDSESGPVGAAPALAGPVAGDTAKSSLGGASSAVGRGPAAGSETSPDASTSTTRGTGAKASPNAGAPAPAASGGRGGGPAVPLAAAPPAPAGPAPGGTPTDGGGTGGTPTDGGGTGGTPTDGGGTGGTPTDGGGTSVGEPVPAT